jgi:hypothetical protein
MESIIVLWKESSTFVGLSSKRKIFVSQLDIALLYSIQIGYMFTIKVSTLQFSQFMDTDISGDKLRLGHNLNVFIGGLSSGRER